jgi:hypothetical protein
MVNAFVVPPAYAKEAVAQTALHDQLSGSSDHHQDANISDPKYYLVDVADIKPTQPASAFDPDEIEALAQSILATGQLVRPLVVQEDGPMSYSVLSGDLEYHAAARAKQLNPRAGEMVAAFVAKPAPEPTIGEMLEEQKAGADGPSFTWEDVPSLWEAGDLSAVADALDQNSESFDYSGAARLLSILGVSDSRKKQLLGKGYEAEFKKKYPQGTWYNGSGYDLEMLQGAIESSKALSSQKNKDNRTFQNAVKTSAAAVKAGTATEDQERIADLARQRDALLLEADKLKDVAASMDAEWKADRGAGKLRPRVEGLSAFGQGPVGQRQMATKKRYAAQKLKDQIIALAKQI